MKTGIYYFSATGNSLTTAKLLAASLDGQCDVISLAALHIYKISKLIMSEWGLFFQYTMGICHIL